MSLALVADIGGTNTRVALADGPVLRQASVLRYRNTEHPGLEEVLQHYLGERGDPGVAGACVAVAGPVRGGVGKLTNLDWQIDEATLARATGAARVALLNDLQAQGHALDHLAPGALDPLLPGPAAEPGAARLVVGIGTGFNAAAVHATGAGTLVTASESGHVNLPVETEEDLHLAQFTRGSDGFAAVEDVLSGRGLAHVYAWVSAQGGHPAEADSATIMHRMAEGEPAAREALRVFTRYLGIISGNLALTFLPFGGMFLCGGMARAVAPYLADLGFAEAFHGKGRFTPLMQGFGVAVIEDDYAALTGCAGYLAHM